jgi:hypothetical protein
MMNYWTTVLQQQPADLPRFLSTVSTSPILLPFDATGTYGNTPLASLLTNESSTPFPPPLACYPGLGASTLQEVNAVETAVFSLSSASAAARFDQACYASRPIYGVLDITRLRLPFLDARQGVAKQAAVLRRDVIPRAVVYSGEVLSGLPGGASDAPNITAASTDPREFGTTNHMNHVMLNYLSSIPDTSTAAASFVLGTPQVPPANTSALYGALAALPALEVAVFGAVLPADVAGVASSFATPSGALFFGSDQAAALRQWAVNAAGASVVWADGARAPEVVRDADLADATFNLVWDPAYLYLHSQTTGVVVNVGNVTDAFDAVGKMAP